MAFFAPFHGRVGNIVPLLNGSHDIYLPQQHQPEAQCDCRFYTPQCANTCEAYYQNYARTIPRCETDSGHPNPNIRATPPQQHPQGSSMGTTQPQNEQIFPVKKCVPATVPMSVVRTSAPLPRPATQSSTQPRKASVHSIDAKRFSLSSVKEVPGAVQRTMSRNDIPTKGKEEVCKFLIWLSKLEAGLQGDNREQRDLLRRIFAHFFKSNHLEKVVCQIQDDGLQDGSNTGDDATPKTYTFTSSMGKAPLVSVVHPSPNAKRKGPDGLIGAPPQLPYHANSKQDTLVMAQKIDKNKAKVEKLLSSETQKATPVKSASSTWRERLKYRTSFVWETLTPYITTEVLQYPKTAYYTTTQIFTITPLTTVTISDGLQIKSAHERDVNIDVPATKTITDLTKFMENQTNDSRAMQLSSIADKETGAHPLDTQDDTKTFTTVELTILTEARRRIHPKSETKPESGTDTSNAKLAIDDDAHPKSMRVSRSVSLSPISSVAQDGPSDEGAESTNDTSMTAFPIVKRMDLEDGTGIEIRVSPVD